MAWQIYLLTDSALQVGLLGLARAVPQIAGSLVGGMIADAFDRRRVLAAVQVGTGVVAAGLALLTLVGLASPPVLLSAAVLFALGTAVETPSRQAVVPNLVASEELAAAIALNNTQRSVATIVGPSLAGVALAIVGPEACYAADAASRVAMVAALALIARPLQGGALTRASLDALVAGRALRPASAGDPPRSCSSTSARRSSARAARSCRSTPATSSAPGRSGSGSCTRLRRSGRWSRARR